jgi:DNA-binding LacI/PurR family transcriptional regulator
VAVYDFNDPFFGALIEQLQAEAHAKDYSLVLAGFLQRVPDERDVQSLHKHAIDGLVILGSDPVAEWVKAFDHLPIARIGHGPEDEKSVRISVDEQAAGRQLLDYLTAAGRTRLVCLSANSPAHVWRQDTLAKEASAAGVRLQLLQSRFRDPFKAGMEVVNLLSEGTEKSDALLCTSDQVAMGALHALHDAGIRVPESMAVTGFDGIVAGEQFLPPITTIRQPVGEMAKEAFESVVAVRGPECVNLAAELVVRESA